MRITVIIPTFNEERMIGNLIRELHFRADDNIHQLIVADGGSDDRTIEIATKLGADVVRCRKRSRAAQMNEGTEAATGQILYFLHADTIPPKKFNRLIRQAISNGAGAGCFQLQFDSDHPVLRFYGWCTRFTSTLVRFGDQSLFVKSDLFQKAGGFDERLSIMEDQKIVRDLKKITSFFLLDQAVETSARKYQQNGIFRLQLIFLVILMLYYFGAQQDTLTHLYNSLIKRGKYTKI